MVKAPVNLIGSVLDGRYRVEELLGKGGMGAVFRAVQEGLGRSVALKVIAGSGSEDARKRFRREARSVAKLHHPGIAQVYDFGSTEEGLLYLAMELVRGGSLSVFRERPPYYTDVMRVADQILAALAYTHARGVIHRDLKPDNVLFTSPEDGPRRVKVVDFGIAAVLDDDVTLTATGRTVGTPIYMAPEQATAQKVGPAADIYSLGVMLYEIFSGRPPFTGRKPIDVMYAKVRERPPMLDPRDGVHLPEELVAVIMRALSRNPERRYEFAADMREAIHPFLVRADLRSGPDVSQGQEAMGPPAGGYSTSAVSVAAPAAPAALEGELPIVGRKPERRRLSKWVERVCQGRGVVVAIEGEGGIGKTRLVHWLRTRVQEEGTMRAFVGSHAAGSEVWAGMRSVVCAALNLYDEEEDERRSQVRQYLRGHGESDEGEVQAVANFVSGGSAPSLQTETLYSLLERLLRRMASVRPLLVVIENIQYAGSDLVQFLEHMRTSLQLSPAPLMMMVTLDPDRVRVDQETDRALRRLLRHDGESLLRVRMEPLTDDELRDVLAPVLPDGFVAEHIFGRARGNPLFALELASYYRSRSAHDRAALSDSNWSIRAGLLPEDLAEAVGVRLDQVLDTAGLDESAQDVLNCAAVLGARFRVGELEALLGAQTLHGDGLSNLLDDLVEERVLVEVDPYQEDILEFRPVLLQDLILGRMPDEERKELHARAAQLVAERGRQDGEGWTRRAYHEAESGALVAASQSYSQAAEVLREQQRYVEAALSALRQSEMLDRASRADEAAWVRYRAALALQRLGETDRCRPILVELAGSSDRGVRILAKCRLASLYQRVGWTRAAMEIYEGLPELDWLADLKLSDEVRGEIKRQVLLTTAALSNRLPEVVAPFEALESLNLEAQEPMDRAEILEALGFYHLFKGSKERIQEYGQALLEATEGGVPTDLRMVAYNMLLEVEQDAEKMFTLRQKIHEEVESLGRLGLGGLLAPAHNAVGELDRSLGRFEDSVHHYRAAIETCRGNAEANLWVYRTNLALALRSAGREGEALEQLQQAMEERGQDVRSNAILHLAMAAFSVSQGNHDRALRALDDLAANNEGLSNERDVAGMFDELIAVGGIIADRALAIQKRNAP